MLTGRVPDSIQDLGKLDYL